MEMSVTEAKSRLTELVRRALAGEEVVLTKHGEPAVRLAPVAQDASGDREARLARLRDISKSAASRARPGPSAARSADFLYDDETGLPK